MSEKDEAKMPPATIFVQPVGGFESMPSHQRNYNTFPREIQSGTLVGRAKQTPTHKLGENQGWLSLHCEHTYLVPVIHAGDIFGPNLIVKRCEFR